jgi:hypothetical protein
MLELRHDGGRCRVAQRARGERLSYNAIAAQLNTESRTARDGEPWTRAGVFQLLSLPFSATRDVATNETVTAPAAQPKHRFPIGADVVSDLCTSGSGPLLCNASSWSSSMTTAVTYSGQRATGTSPRSCTLSGR